MLPPLILEKVEINTVQVMDQFPVGYQLSACPLVSMIKLLKRRIIRYITSRVFFLFFFCKRFLCVFKTVSTQLNLFVCNILSKRTLEHRPSAQNIFIDVTNRYNEYRTVYGPVPNRLPVISMSTRSHDKTVETPDNPVYDVLFFL